LGYVLRVFCVDCIAFRRGEVCFNRAEATSGCYLGRTRR